MRQYSVNVEVLYLPDNEHCMQQRFLVDHPNVLEAVSLGLARALAFVEDTKVLHADIPHRVLDITMEVRYQ